MFKDQLISSDEAKRILANSNQPQNKVIHPLVGISRNLPTHLQTQKKIALEELCEWFAEKCEVPYFYIDPLKINIAAVTKVVASQYARQNGILAVKNESDLVTIAVKNPLDLGWKDKLSSLLRNTLR